MLDLLEIRDWRKALGMSNIPLFETDANRFIMMNGSSGNFCLSLANADTMSDTQCRSLAWSSDVSHFINVFESKVEVHRWDKKSIERYSSTSVAKNLPKFHEYITNDQPRRELSVINHVMRVFKQLWQSLGPNVSDGSDALKAFLYLLAYSQNPKTDTVSFPLK